jgi:hypothetical protein
MGNSQHTQQKPIKTYERVRDCIHKRLPDRISKTMTLPDDNNIFSIDLASECTMRVMLESNHSIVELVYGNEAREYKHIPFTSTKTMTNEIMKCIDHAFLIKYEMLLGKINSTDQLRCQGRRQSNADISDASDSIPTQDTGNSVSSDQCSDIMAYFITAASISKGGMFGSW